MDTETNELQYVALSYCWGKGTTLALTSTRLEEFKRQIPWAWLPKTYQQAVNITRSLGLSFLWIDSICIIQEGGEDWQTESAKMADIYQNAELVVSADSGVNTDSGFLYDRSPTWHSPDRIELPARKGGPAYLTALVDPPDGLKMRHLPFLEEPIFRRAWCLQEGLSAKRLIRFAKDEVHWECNTCVSCECGWSTQAETEVEFRAETEAETDQQNDKFNDKIRARRGRKQIFHYALARSISTKVLSGVWVELISEYSRRSLGVELDRLPAIAGIAKQMASPLLGDYLAGIWRKQLPGALLWSRVRSIHEDTDAEFRRPVEYRAPSWSWPSVLGPIASRGEGVDAVYEADVLSAECRVEGLNPYGCVSAGSLALSAIVFNARLQPRTESHSKLHGEPPPIASPAGTFSSTGAALAVDAASMLLNCGHEYSVFHPDYHWTITGGFQEVLCVIVIARQNHAAPDSANCESIILVPCSTQQGMYQRVGMAMFELPHIHMVNTQLRKITIV